MPKGIFIRTEEYKRKISEAKKGCRQHPNSGFQKGHKASPEIRAKISRALTGKYCGPNHPCFIGRKISQGYILVYVSFHPFCDKGGYVFEHRLVMEQKLGRYLNPIEVCHHINGIKDDNRIENLMLFKNHSEHMKIHPAWNKGKKTGIIPKTAFKKGEHFSPSTEFKKKEHNSIKTEFKKGHNLHQLHPEWYIKNKK